MNPIDKYIHSYCISESAKFLIGITMKTIIYVLYVYSSTRFFVHVTCPQFSFYCENGDQ